MKPPSERPVSTVAGVSLDRLYTGGKPSSPDLLRIGALVSLVPRPAKGALRWIAQSSEVREHLALRDEDVQEDVGCSSRVVRGIRICDEGITWYHARHKTELMASGLKARDRPTSSVEHSD
jgi:hypothetical protein